MTFTFHSLLSNPAPLHHNCHSVTTFAVSRIYIVLFLSTDRRFLHNTRKSIEKITLSSCDRQTASCGNIKRSSLRPPLPNYTSQSAHPPFSHSCRLITTNRHSAHLNSQGIKGTTFRCILQAFKGIEMSRTAA
jgi:hypothetical protein